MEIIPRYKMARPRPLKLVVPKAGQTVEQEVKEWNQEDQEEGSKGKCKTLCLTMVFSSYTILSKSNGNNKN